LQKFGIGLWFFGNFFSHTAFCTYFHTKTKISGISVSPQLLSLHADESHDFLFNNVTGDEANTTPFDSETNQNNWNGNI